jgi:hypothetical protein
MIDDGMMSNGECYVEPIRWAEWVDNAGAYQSLIAEGQEWIKSDLVVEVRQ